MKLRSADNWDSPLDANPIEDCKKAFMLIDNMSEREAEIMVEGLMGKRKLDASLVCDIMFHKLRKSSEAKE